MVNELILEFQTLTPLFLGGAEPGRPELRPPSLKGALRFWYRAVDPNFKEGEGRFFGGTDDKKKEGQSPFSLRIIPTNTAPPLCGWEGFKVRRFNTGSEVKTQNGLVYLGFPFQMGKKDFQDRKPEAIGTGYRFTVRCVFLRGAEDPKLRQAVLSSFWLLGHLGGIGSRSRRGFGSLALLNWQTVGNSWPEMAELPLLQGRAGVKEWVEGWRQAKNCFRTWFPKPEPVMRDKKEINHPHLGDTYNLVIQVRSFEQKAWDAALAEMGSHLQTFRLRRQPDYDRVKLHLRGSQYLTQTPERAAFGLPLTFRYSSQHGSVTFTPYNPSLEDAKSALSRHASLLHLRLVLLNGRLHPLYLRLNGTVSGEKSQHVTIQGQNCRLRPIGENNLGVDLL
ncbi:MAG: type III-B CRISPR module RAMP protein Cmr1 [Magnetococcus sp. DMHC-6]